MPSWPAKARESGQACFGGGASVRARRRISRRTSVTSSERTVRLASSIIFARVVALEKSRTAAGRGFLTGIVVICTLSALRRRRDRVGPTMTPFCDTEPSAANSTVRSLTTKTSRTSVSASFRAAVSPAHVREPHCYRPTFRVRRRIEDSLCTEKEQKRRAVQAEHAPSEGS